MICVVSDVSLLHVAFNSIYIEVLYICGYTQLPTVLHKVAETTFWLKCC